MPIGVTPDAQRLRDLAATIGGLPGDPNTAASDAPVLGQGGQELTVGKAVGATPAGQALADLAMSGRGPQFSAGNPYATAAQGAIQGQARENMYNSTGAQAGPFGSPGGGGDPTPKGFARVTPRARKPPMSTGSGAAMGGPRY